MTRRGKNDDEGDLLAAAELSPIIANKYAIEWEIDQGAMGRVFAATQLGLERAVAIKIMSEGDVHSRARFLVEAHSLASLNHRNVVTIYDSGELSSGVVFIVMEYLRGETLASALKREGRFDVARALSIALQVTRGLRAAHRQGIVHRDLKPSNIYLVEDDEEREIVKIFDFGIAKAPPLSGAQAAATAEDLIIGTPAYMAPEQIESHDIDARADLYSLGCMLYQAIAGRTPFVAATPVELLVAQLRTPPTPLRKLCPSAPVAVEDLVMRLLEKDPASRFPDADALLLALKRLLSSLYGSGALRLPGVMSDPFNDASSPWPTVQIVSSPSNPGLTPGLPRTEVLTPVSGVSAHAESVTPSSSRRAYVPSPAHDAFPRTFSPTPLTPAPITFSRRETAESAPLVRPALTPAPRAAFSPPRTPPPVFPAPAAGPVTPSPSSSSVARPANIDIELRERARAIDADLLAVERSLKNPPRVRRSSPLLVASIAFVMTLALVWVCVTFGDKLARVPGVGAVAEWTQATWRRLPDVPRLKR